MQLDISMPPWSEGLFKPMRYKALHGGRGSGKSWSLARAVLIRCAEKCTRVLCAREVQNSIKDSVHRLLSDQVESLGLGSFFRVLETEIRGRNGSLIVFSGLSQHTVDSLKSFEGIDVVWVEEAQAVSKRSWDVLTPTIRKAGSEIWLSMNPDLDSDETYRRFIAAPRSDAWVRRVNWQDNPYFNSTLEKERLHAQATMTPEDYAHVWEGKCRPAVEGAIYSGEIAAVEEQGRIARVSADPLLRTHAVWDLGWNDAMAIIIVQRAASELRVIDYIEDSHRALPDYVRELDDMDVTWGNDWLPHDGFAKRHQTGKADNEVLKALNREPLMTPNVEVEQGIRTARLVFPRIWFNDTPKVRRLLECLKRYRRNVSPTTGEAGTPRHDEFSHGADAFRYLALVADQLTNTVRKQRAEQPEYATGGWMG